MFSQLSPLYVAFMSHRCQMVGVAELKRWGGEANVILLISSLRVCDRRLVYNALGLALAVQGALVLHPAVASSANGGRAAQLPVRRADVTRNVREAAVADF